MNRRQQRKIVKRMIERDDYELRGGIYPSLDTDYEVIKQRRRERRIFGHDNADCIAGNLCTYSEVLMTVTWCQPGRLADGALLARQRRAPTRR
jgi:hypothetical protein